MFQTVKTVNQQNCHERYADKNLRISFKSGKKRAAIQYADQYGLPITLFGHGMGGYAVCAVLNYADVIVDRVVSVAGFATIREIIHFYAISNIKRFSSLVELLILFVKKCDSGYAIPEILIDIMAKE